MAVSSLGFRSASSLPGNEVLKDGNSESPTSTDNKSPKEHLLPLTKEPGMGQPGKTDAGDNSRCHPSGHHGN